MLTLAEPRRAARRAPVDPDACEGAGATTPLQSDHLVRIREAVAARRPVRRAARTARASALSILAAGGLALPCLAVAPSLAGVLAVAAVLAIGGVELYGAIRMGRADPRAATTLGRNQVALLAVIVVYCAAQMATFSPDDVRKLALSEYLNERLAVGERVAEAIEDDVAQLVPAAVYALYGLVIAVSLAFQGGLAIYYFTRRHHIEMYLRETPQWVRYLFALTR